MEHLPVKHSTKNGMAELKAGGQDEAACGRAAVMNGALGKRGSGKNPALNLLRTHIRVMHIVGIDISFLPCPLHAGIT